MIGIPISDIWSIFSQQALIIPIVTLPIGLNVKDMPSLVISQVALVITTGDIIGICIMGICIMGICIIDIRLGISAVFISIFIAFPGSGFHTNSSTAPPA